MEQKIERPDYVQNFTKPKNTEIKCIGGRWYLYNRESVWEPETKRRTKRSGPIIGRITPEGLVPSRHRNQAAAERAPSEKAAAGENNENAKPKASVLESACGTADVPEAPVPKARSAVRVEEILDAGAVVYLMRQTERMRTQLQKIFPRTWTAIYCLSMLRAVYGCPLSEMQLNMERSLLHKLYPDIALDKKILSDLFHKRLTRRHTGKYLQMDGEGRTLYLILDGGRLQRAADERAEHPTLPYEVSKYYEGLNVLAAFAANADKTVGMPCFYRQCEGSAVREDDLAMASAEMRRAASLTGIGDKETAGPAWFQLLKHLGISYLIPLRRDSAETKDFSFGALEAYSGSILEQDRVIACTSLNREKTRIFAYLDLHLQTEEYDAVCRSRARERLIRETGSACPEPAGHRLSLLIGRDGYLLCAASDEEREAGGQRAYGSLALQTDDEKLSPEDGYRLYQLRQQMEQLFQPLDTLLLQDALYLEDGFGDEGWLFLNHLAGQMIAEAASQLREVGEQEMNARSWLMSLRYVQCSRVNGKWMFPPVPADVDAICRKICFDPTDIGSLGVG